LRDLLARRLTRQNEKPQQKQGKRFQQKQKKNHSGRNDTVSKMRLGFGKRKTKTKDASKRERQVCVVF